MQSLRKQKAFDGQPVVSFSNRERDEKGHGNVPGVGSEQSKRKGGKRHGWRKEKRM